MSKSGMLLFSESARYAERLAGEKVRKATARIESEHANLVADALIWRTLRGHLSEIVVSWSGTGTIKTARLVVNFTKDASCMADQFEKEIRRIAKGDAR